MEERLPPEAPYLRAFLRKLAAGAADFDIDDLVQETMNRALRYQHSFDAAKPLRQWLFAIGFRVFLDHREQSRRTSVVGGTFELTATASTPQNESSTARIDIQPLLAALEEPERGVMERTYLQSQSIRQVANELQMAEGTVKSHLHRARQRLAQRFRAEDWL